MIITMQVSRIVGVNPPSDNKRINLALGAHFEITMAEINKSIASMELNRGFPSQDLIARGYVKDHPIL